MENKWVGGFFPPTKLSSNNLKNLEFRKKNDRKSEGEFPPLKNTDTMSIFRNQIC